MDEVLYQRLYEVEDWHWWFRGRREVIRALLDRVEIPQAPRSLDAGCGTGRNLVELSALGPAEGIDGSAQAVEFCRRRGLDHVREAMLESLPFDDGSFDLILVADVLEHVADDLGALRELRRVASEAGLMLITVPAYRWLWSQHDEIHHHQRRYTRPELVERVRLAGWTPVLSTHFNSLLLPPIAAVRVLSRRKKQEGRSDLDLTPGRLNSALEMPMRFEAKLISQGVRIPFGVSIGLVCRSSDHCEESARSATAPTVAAR